MIAARLIFLLVILVLGGCGPRTLEPDSAIDCERCEDWNAPRDPFRVYGNTWYVGTDGLASILIESDAGLVLVDGGLPQSAALIDANIRSLGFDPLDIKAILVSHVHYDHVGGVAALQKMTGASVYTSEAGSLPLSLGELQEDDPQYLGEPDEGRFPPVRNIVALPDGGLVTVGSLEVRAVYTPGHTAGGVTWTWQSCALNTCYDVVYADSMTAVSTPGFRFSTSGAAAAMTQSADVIANLDCDILLSPHPFFFGMHDKLEQREEGNPFVNNVACMMYAESALGWLERRLEAERD